jgi:predicted SprT family Zn-dependent metalloprotease
LTSGERVELDPVRQVLARWREAQRWRPSPELLRTAQAASVTQYHRGCWPAWPARCFTLAPEPDPGHCDHLLGAYAEFDYLNGHHFGGICPPVKIAINTRLRSTGGNIDTRLRVMELNWLRLTEHPESRVETVFHEMIHLWLYARGMDPGHTPAFKQKMVERGHLSIHYGVAGDPKGPRHAYPGSERNVVYHCPKCRHEYRRRRRFSQPMICGECHQAGRGRHRIVLVEPATASDSEC